MQCAPDTDEFFSVDFRSEGRWTNVCRWPNVCISYAHIWPSAHIWPCCKVNSDQPSAAGVPAEQTPVLSPQGKASRSPPRSPGARRSSTTPPVTSSEATQSAHCLLAPAVAPWPRHPGSMASPPLLGGGLHVPTRPTRYSVPVFSHGRILEFSPWYLPTFLLRA